MRSIEKLREHAKEITKECEKRKYNIEEAEMLVHILKDEINQCKKELNRKDFKALVE